MIWISLTKKNKKGNNYHIIGIIISSISVIDIYYSYYYYRNQIRASNSGTAFVT